MKFHSKIFIIAIILYSATAFLSIGYFHADEHYQIIEFAGILDGTNKPGDMAWEYDTQIRSTIQPVIAFLLFEVCDLLSIYDPYYKAFFLRLITMLFSLFCIYFFAESCKKLIRIKYQKLFFTLTYFLWFLPFINVRFSSETWSGMFLLLSVALLIINKNKNQHYLLMGVLLGLGFLFRYQIAFSIFGIILWLIFIRKEQIIKVGISLISFLIIIFIGILIDSWYYGELTITIKNYFIVNLIDGKAASFGTSPWFYYFYAIVRYSFFPVGILLHISFI